MAYTAILRIDVELLDATWRFQPADLTMAKLGARQAAIGSFDTDAPPEPVIELMPAMFVEGVVEWEGVVDESGQPLDCTEANRRGIPTTDKMEIVTEYLIRLQELEEKKGVSSKPPISSTPNGSSSPESGE